MNIPNYWKSSLADIDECFDLIKKGEKEEIGKSAGGRSIKMVRYGKKNNFNRTSNLSSALGAGDKSCFADKSGEDYVPTVFLVGCTHGGEFEGTVALLNLIKLLETGTDYDGKEHKELKELAEKVTLLIIPCINPDGRSHIPFDSFVGKSFEELRYYNQGTWRDGSLCNWPDCKKFHPIKDYVDYLGGYFNDDGVNIMHDNYFGKKAKETALLLDITEEYAPDFSILFHGGTNSINSFWLPAYVPKPIKKRMVELSYILKEECEKEGLKFSPSAEYGGEDEETPASFNIISAMVHLCGEPCLVYEANQGLTETEMPGESYDEIYKQHIITIRETIKYVLKER